MILCFRYLANNRYKFKNPFLKGALGAPYLDFYFTKWTVTTFGSARGTSAE